LRANVHYVVAKQANNFRGVLGKDTKYISGDHYCEQDGIIPRELVVANERNVAN
jgi:hypothetical protein